MKKLSDDVFGPDGKVVKAAEYEIDVPQKIKITVLSVKQRISHLTDELARWKALEDQLNALK